MTGISVGQGAERNLGEVERVVANPLPEVRSHVSGLAGIFRTLGVNALHVGYVYYYLVIARSAATKQSI